jgi:GntR family transcriptional regulator
VPAQRIDPLGPVPPYRQIAAIIKRRILSGQYAPNTRIPTESELVETYEVARSTARRAIAALRDDGLVYTVPARGTYVAERGNGTKQATGSSGTALINAP